MIPVLITTPDGNFIVFIANDPAVAGNTLIYLRNMQAGTNLVVSVDENNQTPTAATCGFAGSRSDWPICSVFVCSGANMTTNPVTKPSDMHIYLRDTQNGITQMIEVDTNGTGVGAATSAFAMRQDGQLVAFDNISASLVPNDCNRDSDVFVRNPAQRAPRSWMFSASSGTSFFDTKRAQRSFFHVGEHKRTLGCFFQ